MTGTGAKGGVDGCVDRDMEKQIYKDKQKINGRYINNRSGSGVQRCWS